MTSSTGSKNAGPSRKSDRRRRSHWSALACCLALPLLVSADTASGPDPVLRELLRRAIEASDSFGDRFDAEVWLKFNSERLARKVPDPKERLEILRQVHYEARRAGLEPELVLAVIDVESNFDRFAISRAGAQGLMQVMSFWLEEIGHPDDNLMDIQTNLRMGCTILRYYLDMEKGQKVPALARYHGSYPRRYYADRVLDRLRMKWYRQ
jgi:soluble lytic murein transglycosylase-like protein